MLPILWEPNLKQIEKLEAEVKYLQAQYVDCNRVIEHVEKKVEEHCYDVSRLVSILEERLSQSRLSRKLKDTLQYEEGADDEIDDDGEEMESFEKEKSLTSRKRCKAVYRRICWAIHPDRFADKKIPKELVDLAKDAAAAYNVYDLDTLLNILAKSEQVKNFARDRKLKSTALSLLSRFNELTLRKAELTEQLAAIRNKYDNSMFYYKRPTEFLDTAHLHLVDLLGEVFRELDDEDATLRKDISLMEQISKYVDTSLTSFGLYRDPDRDYGSFFGESATKKDFDFFSNESDEDDDDEYYNPLS